MNSSSSTSAMDDMGLLRQQEAERHHHHHDHHHHHNHHHHLVVREIGEEIDLEIGPGDDEPPFNTPALVVGHHLTPQGAAHHHHAPPTSLVEEREEEEDDQKHILLLSASSSSHPPESLPPPPPPPPSVDDQQAKAKRKRKVVKKWREEWADTYRWAYVDLNEGTTRIFCSVCKEYGRKHRRNPYGNEGSRNMQMSALEEHNNSLLHKEALRLQSASKDKSASGNNNHTPISPVERHPVYVQASSIVEAVLRRDPHEVEFLQTVQEVVHSLEPVLTKNTQYARVLERLLEPERTVVFRVPWMDDKGEIHVNRGFRVQFSRVLGPCRGGLRFHPSMNLSIAKFLGFEQTMKNALSPYKLGGAGGGSDFDPRGKTDNEIVRFCQSFMDELYRYLGPDQDLPAEDIGVGPREMGYLFGHYKRISGQFHGSFTLPKLFWSGPSLRTEATGYGLVFFARLILAEMNKELKGLRCIVSGAGKIAMHVLEKLLTCGAIPITMSDSKGYVFDEDGFSYEKFSLLRDIKMQQRSLRDYLKSYAHAKYVDGAKPWSEQCDIAFPCACQNEIDQNDAVALVNSGCQLLIEGSSMSCTPQAVDVLRKAKILVAPSKAASAGGVAVRELELNNDYNLLHFSAEDFESKLQESLKQTYERSIKAASDHGILKDNPEALVHGGNVCAFLNLARAMIDQGCV